MDNEIYEFGLKLPDKYANNICLFNTVAPETIDEGLNGCFQEKIRRFNNSVIHLVDSIRTIESLLINEIPVLVACKDEGNEADIIYRRMMRNVYMELFIYQEKLLNIVCNLFFVKVSNNRRTNFSRLKKRIKYSEELKIFCDKCDDFIKDNICRKVMQIRDDEVHNMSQIDSFNYDLDRNVKWISPITKGYKLKAIELRENYIYTMKKLLEVRNSVQDILDRSDFWKISFALEKDGEEVYIN